MDARASRSEREPSRATDESVGVLTVIALAAAARLGDARTATDRGDTSPNAPEPPVHPPSRSHVRGGFASGCAP
jgi:hypothetical protein